MTETIYTQEPGRYHVQKTVGGYVVIYIEDRHTMRSVDGGKVHANRQNAYAKASRLNDAMLKTVEEAAQAKAQGKVVLADWAGRRVTINTILQGNDGRWHVEWSHSDYPHARWDEVSES